MADTANASGPPASSIPRTIVLLTCGVMVCFAFNSLLCRWALAPDEHGRGLIDPYTFALLRALGATSALAFVLGGKIGKPHSVRSKWPRLCAWVGYALCFCQAYNRIDAGVGAIILFGSSQGFLVLRSSSLRQRDWIGLTVAFVGLLVLVLPGATFSNDSRALTGAAMMLTAGICWGWYTDLGQLESDAVRANFQAFSLSLPVFLAPVALAVYQGAAHFTTEAAALALTCGALTTAGGYALWYRVLGHWSKSAAGTWMLSVPIIVAVLGVLLLDDTLTINLVISLAAVSIGIYLTLPKSESAAI